MFMFTVIGLIMGMVVLYVDPPSRGPEAQQLFEERWASSPLIPGLITGLPLLLVLLGLEIDAILAVLLAGALWLLVTAAWLWHRRT